MASLDNLVQTVCVSILPVLFAITIPVGVQAWVAHRLGDRTAAMLGRLTLNPAKHIDPIGTILLPLIGIVMGGFLIGWPRQLPININALRNPKTDLGKIAAVTPLTNLVLVVFWALVVRLSMYVPDYFGVPLSLMGDVGVRVNASLMIFTLIPLPPLPGGVILQSLLPRRAAYKLSMIEPYSFWILLALMFTGVLGVILLPLVKIVYYGAFGLVGLI